MDITRELHNNVICIYSFINKINGKRYIGQSINLYKRYTNHKVGQSGAPIFKRAISKYGWHNFEIEILEECDRTLLTEREAYWIKFYNTTNKKFGYNIVEKQEGNNTRSPISEKTREKMKESFKRRYPNGIYGENNPNYGKRMPDWQRELLKKANLKKWPNGKGGENNNFYGKKHTEEAKLKQSVAKIGSVPPNRKVVLAIDSNNVILEFESVRAASKFVNCTEALIRWAIRKSKSTKGYTWQFKS